MSSFIDFADARATRASDDYESARDHVRDQEPEAIR
jgi:hypothetical protein